ncbi:hypothetical protein FQR65_LT20012 [Abscondita terminalis]|nr:hypothetical protein FQR65_LT20012 [Abscondita terminalis]
MRASEATEGAGSPIDRILVRPAWASAWRWKSSGGEGGLTPSQEQLRHREVGWGGSWRQILAPRYTNRIRQAGLGSVCKCGGGQGKVDVLIRGGLSQCVTPWSFLWVERSGCKGQVDGAGVSRRHSTDGNVVLVGKG